MNGCIGYMRSIGLSHVREEPELIKVNRIIQSPVKSVRDPTLNAKLNYIIRYKQ